MNKNRRKFIGSAVAGIGGVALGAGLGTETKGAPPPPPPPAQRTRRSLTINNASPTTKLLIHGGVGVIERGSLSPEREREYHAALREALLTGNEVLKRNGSALDAVEAVIRLMEDSPLFNAGRGAVFTNAETNELDASVMDGKTLMAGAVASLRHIKNPISLARMVMEKSRHVMLVGDGAEQFAKEHGIALVAPEYFRTERRLNDLRRIKEEERKKETQRTRAGLDTATATAGNYFGTVGAVALDNAGNLAAATSTGGMTNKRWGRVGDSPIVGAGTYADNRTCAISATGDGEYFIRLGVARDISALMEYRGLSVKEAARIVIQEKLTKLGGGGGVIALDKTGNFTTEFNLSGMYRGYISPNGEPLTAIYKE